MFVKSIKDQAIFVEKNNAALMSGELRMIREYGDNRNVTMAMSDEYLKAFIRARRDRVLGRRNIATPTLPASLMFAKTSPYSYEEIIFMNTPHGFIADVDMEIGDIEVTKKYWECISLGLPTILRCVGVTDMTDYEEATICGPVKPSNHQAGVMKSVWMLTHAALFLARQASSYSGALSLPGGTARIYDVTIEASIVADGRVDDENIKKYSYHVRTSAIVRNNKTAHVIGGMLSSLMTAAALNGISLADASTAKYTSDRTRELVTSLISNGDANMTRFAASITSSLPTYNASLVAAFMRIKTVDMGFYNARHNLRMCWEVKPTKKHYLVPYTFNVAALANVHLPGRESVILRARYDVTGANCLDVTLLADEKRRTGTWELQPSDPVFVKATILRYKRENPQVTITPGDVDGIYKINRGCFGADCELCNVHHDQGSNNSLLFSGAFCRIICSRYRYHAGSKASILYARDENYDDDVTAEEKMMAEINRERKAQMMNDEMDEMDERDDDDDEDAILDEAENRRYNAAKVILEDTTSYLTYSHDVHIFSAPTLVADDDAVNHDDADAEYDYPTINVPQNGMVYIRSALGTGKTKWLLRHIAAMLTAPQKRGDGDKRPHGFIVVSTRIVQTQAFIEKYNAYLVALVKKLYRSEKKREAILADWLFVAYNKVPDVNAPRNLIIQVDSLGKLNLKALRDRKYTLILDEAVSILEQTQSENIRDYAAIADTFKCTVGYASAVILMDGHIIAEHIECFDRIRGLMMVARKRRAEMPLPSIATTVKDYREPRPLVYVNTYRPQNDRVYHATNNRDDWLTTLAYVAGNAQRARIVVAANSLDCCRTVEAMIRASTDPHLRKCTVKVYTSETGEIEKRTAFEDVHESWGDADILIYSPTVGAGISFEKKRFDALFGYCSAGSTTAETFVQLLNRVRDIRHNDAYVFIDPMKTYGLYTTVPSLRKAIIESDYIADGARMTIDSDGNEAIADEGCANGILRLYATTHENRSKIDLTKRCMKLLMHLSKDVRVLALPEGKHERVLYKDNKEAAKATAYERFDAAVVLDYEEYEDAKERKKMGLTTQAEGDSVNKTAIMKRYKMSKDFTEDGWAADYLPHLDEYAEKLAYVTQRIPDGVDVIAIVKEQSKEAAGTTVSEYVDKTIVSEAILALADHLGTPYILNDSDTYSRVICEDGTVTCEKHEDDGEVTTDVTKHTKKSWRKFMKTAPNFGKKPTDGGTKIANVTNLLSGKASKWAKSYMSMHNEILGYLSDGDEGIKKCAKSLDTLHKRLSKAIYAFYGSDVSGKDRVIFKRPVSIRWGSAGSGLDGKTHVPRIVPIVTAEGHKYLRRKEGRLGGIIINSGDEEDLRVLSSETLIRKRVKAV